MVSSRCFGVEGRRRGEEGTGEDRRGEERRLHWIKATSIKQD